MHLKGIHIDAQDNKGSLNFQSLSRQWVALVIFILFVGLVPNTVKAQTWYSTSWLYRKAITIDFTKVGTGPHTNFPVLINVTDTDLKNYAMTNANDILFTSSDGTTKLAHEIENYTSGTGALVAWVQIPSLSSTANTVIYMYYGNSVATSQQNITGTWNTNFKGVYHLNSVFTDATSNANNGTNSGTTSGTGKISGARVFSKAGPNYISIPGLMGSPANATLSAWADLNTRDVTGSHIVNIGDYLSINADDVIDGYLGAYYNAGWGLTKSSPKINAAGSGWHYFVFTFNDAGNAQTLYMDGVQVGSGTYTGSINYSTQGTNTFIGKHGNGSVNYDFDGTIDEVRIANAVRSAGWILTEYNNQNSPSTFYSLATQTTYAKVFTGIGNFSTPARWSDGVVPVAGENMIIDGTCTIDDNAGTDNIAYGTLTIGHGTGRTLNWAASGTNRLNVSSVGAFTGASTLDMTNGGTLIVRGTITSTNLTFTAGAGTIELRATTTLPSAYTTYKNLTVNGSGITVGLAAATTSFTGDLTITAGTLNTNGLNINASGNWSNNGTFTAGTGTVTFSGGNSQTITSTGTGSFYRVTINKSANDVTLNNNITVTNLLTLTARNVILGTNDFTVGSSGSISGGSSTSSIVTNNTGKLTQNNIGSGARTGGIVFPVSTTSSYTPITINNTGTADAFSVRVFDNVYLQGTAGAAITTDIVKKTWMVSESVAGGSNVTLTAQWNAIDEGTGFSRTTCGLSHYISSWDTPAFTSAGGSNPYTVSRSGITSFSPFAVEEGTVPLPVNLLYFSSKQENNNIILNWATSSERNNKGFQVEKSLDGINFVSIGFIEGYGNSATKLNYSFTDSENITNNSYYRLKQLDWDGRFEYSSVICISTVINAKKILMVYPNPITTWIEIAGDVELTHATDITFTVTSCEGYSIIHYTGTLQEATSILNEKLDAIKSGIYFIKIRSRYQDYVQKFIKN